MLFSPFAITIVTRSPAFNAADADDFAFNRDADGNSDAGSDNDWIGRGEEEQDDHTQDYRQTSSEIEQREVINDRNGDGKSINVGSHGIWEEDQPTGRTDFPRRPVTMNSRDPMKSIYNHSSMNDGMKKVWGTQDSSGQEDEQLSQTEVTVMSPDNLSENSEALVNKAPMLK